MDGRDRYEDPGQLARWLRRMLWAQVVTGLVASGFTIAYLVKLADMTEAAHTESTAFEDVGLMASGLLDLGLYGVTAITFVVWTYQSYKNLPALGSREPRYRKGWAIAGWLVPIMWLFRPKQVLNEIWRGSDDALPPSFGRSDIVNPNPPAWMAVWWLLWLVAGWIGFRAIRTGADTVAEDQLGWALSLVSLLFLVIAAPLAVRVVGTLTARQQRRAARLAELPATPPSFEATPERPL